MKKFSLVLCVLAVAVIIAAAAFIPQSEVANAAPNTSVTLTTMIEHGSLSSEVEAGAIYLDDQYDMWYIDRYVPQIFMTNSISIYKIPSGTFNKVEYSTNLGAFSDSGGLGITGGLSGKLWVSYENKILNITTSNLVADTRNDFTAASASSLDGNQGTPIATYLPKNRSNDTLFFINGKKINERVQENFIYKTNELTIAGGTDHGLFTDVCSDVTNSRSTRNLWITSASNKIIRQNYLNNTDYQVFTKPGNFANFNKLSAIFVDDNGDVWAVDKGNSGSSRILRYRVRENFWNEYKITDFSGSIYDIAVRNDGRVFCATDEGLEYVDQVFPSSESNIVSFSPSGANVNSNNYSITYSTDERRVTFSAEVSNGATYSIYSDSACTTAIPNNILETPLAFGQSTANINAWIKVIAADGEGYSIYTVTVTRNKRQLKIKPIDQTVVYGDSYVNRWEIVGNLLDSDTVDILDVRTVFYDSSYNGNVGSGTIIIESFNYNANKDYTITKQTGKITVIPRDISISLSPLTKTYASEDPALQYTITEGTLASRDVVSSELVRIAGEDVGDYEINGVKIVKDGVDKTSNYNVNIVDTGTLTIDPLKIEIDGVNNLTKTKVYDHNTSVNTSGATLVTNILPEDTEVTLSITASYNSIYVTNANQITLSFAFAGSSAKNANYILPDDYVVTDGVSITKKELTISDVQAANRTYVDELYTVAISGGALNGVFEEDTVSFNLKGTGFVSDCNAGTDKIVTTDIILTGNHSSNYFLTQPNYVRVDILPVVTEVIWEYSSTYIYNAQDQSATIKAYYRNLSGERVDLGTEIAEGEIFKNVGTYTAQAFMIDIDGNYDIGTPTSTIDIIPLKITTTMVVNTQKTYDGNTTAIISNPGTTNIIDATVTLSYTANFNTSNVGANSIKVIFTLNGEGKENYEEPDEYSLSGTQVKINPFETSVVWSYEDEYIYDGTDRADTVSATCKDIAGSDINLTVSFAQAFVNAGTHQATASLADTNYRLVDNVTNIVIEKRQIEVSGLTITKTKTYDGTSTATYNNDFISNVLSDATLVPLALYNSKNVTEASYITVSFSLTGAGANNYVLPEGYTVNNANITALRITVEGYTVESVKYYDGNKTANITGTPVTDIVANETQIEIKAEFDNFACGVRTVRVWFILHNNDWGNYVAPFEYNITDGARINPRPVNVVWEKDEQYIYNGADRSESVRAYYEDISGNRFDLEVSFEVTFRNAGNYIASVSLDNESYQVTNSELELTIAPLPIVLDGFTLLETKVFDGTTAAAVSGWTHNIVEKDDAKLNINAFYNSQNVAEASLITVRFFLTGTDASNYVKPTDYSIDEASITPLEVAIDWASNERYVYDGTNHSNSISAKYVDISGVNKSLKIDFNLPFVNAGDYSAKASMIKEDPNYFLTGEWKSYTIEKLQIIVNNLDITREKAFDGGTTANIVEGYTTNIKDETTRLQINANYNTKGINASSITVNFSFADSAATNNNYLLPSQMVITEGVRISPKGLTISGVSAVGREYDGTTLVELAGGVLNGIIDNGMVSANLGLGEISSPNASFVPYTVTTNITLSGADKDNYTLIQPAGIITVVISAKVVDINWCEDDFTYNGFDQRSSVFATYTAVDDSIVGLTVSSNIEFKDYNENGYVFVAALRYDETNYLLPAVKTSVYHIKKVALIDTTTDRNVEYDGTAQGIEISAEGFYGEDGISSGTVLYGTTSTNYGYTENILKTNAGTYEIFYRVTFDNYETIAGSKKIIIAPRKSEVIWIYQEFVYNGTDQSNKVSASITSVSSTLIYLAISSNEVFKNAGEYTFTAECRDSNYTLNNPTKVINIAAVPVTVRIKDMESKEGEPLKDPTCTVTTESGSVLGTLDVILTKASGLTAGYYPITGECSDPNYNVTWINGTYTISQASISSEETEGDKIVKQVTVQSVLGLKPDNKLSVVDISKEFSNTDYTMNEGKVIIKKAFNINIMNSDDTVVPVNGVVSVRILISEDLRHEKNLKVIYIDDFGSITDMNAVRDGDYLVFNTTHFSTYAIVSVDEKSIFPLILYITLPIAALIIIIFAIVIARAKKKRMMNKLSYASAPIQAYVPNDIIIPSAMEEVTVKVKEEIPEEERKEVLGLAYEAYHRFDISDDVWQILVTGLPARKSLWSADGLADRKFINAVFWVLRTGMPWQDLPSDYGKWGSVYRRYIRWREKGIWKEFCDILNNHPDFEWMKTLQIKAISPSKD